VLSFTGCTPFTSKAESAVIANQPPLVVTPEVVAARLHPVAALPEAAGELASLLGVAPEQVRVRLRLTSCITCNLNEVEAAGSREGLAVGAAAEQLEPDMTLWLFVQNFTCTYLYDGKFLRPRQCQLAPI
jgi:hypothetical protein